MRGLVAYDDDSQSDTEIVPPSNAYKLSNDKSSRTGSKSSSEARSIKSQVIIKKPSERLRHHQPRAHVGQELESEPSTSQGAVSNNHADDHSTTSSGAGPSTPRPQEDELTSIRTSLKPPPIFGVDDWGIPAESNEPVDPALEAKLKQFAELKKNPSNPRHFNDSLMSNRSFRNPHLYTKLVEFVDVDERTTNFPRDMWDPNDVKMEWFADQIAEAQKERSEKQAANQNSGKRSRIDFASSSRPAGGGAKGKDVFGIQPTYSHGPAAKRSRLQIPTGGNINSGYSSGQSRNGQEGTGRHSRWGPA